MEEERFIGGWTRSKLTERTPAERYAIWKRAKGLRTADGNQLAREIERLGLPYAEPGELNAADPMREVMVEIVNSPEARSAVIEATLDGLPGNGLGTMFASSEPVAPPAVVSPRPAPQRLALVSPEAETEVPAVVAVARPALPPANAPLPPVRPFDLGTLPGADVQIAAPRGAQPAGPRDTFATVVERQPAPQARPLALLPPPRPAFVESDLPPRR